MRQRLTERQSSDEDPNKIRRLLLKLSFNANKLPTSFMLRDVVCPQAVSYGAGAFSDVYRGTMGTMEVAIKRLRTHSTALVSTEEEKMQLEKVNRSMFFNMEQNSSGLHRISVGSPFYGKTYLVFTSFRSLAFLRTSSRTKYAWSYLGWRTAEYCIILPS